MQRTIRNIVLMGVVCLGSGFVAATILPAPAAVTVYAGQSTPQISVTLTYSGADLSGSDFMDVTSLPPGVTTSPSPVTYSFLSGSSSTTTSFRIHTDLSTPPGTYPVQLSDRHSTGGKADAGSGILMLTVAQSTFTAMATPNPVSLTAGGMAALVTVSTITDPGFGQSSLLYTFRGFPSFIQSGGTQSTPGPAFAPLSFQFTTDFTATPGTYTGRLEAASAGGAVLKTYPMTVQVQPAAPPVISVVLPSSLIAGDPAAQLTIQGSGFQPGATIDVTGSGIELTNVQVISVNQLSCTAVADENATTGPRQLIVSNPDGQRSNPANLTVTAPPPPILATVMPSTLVAGQPATQLTIQGSGFRTGVSVEISGQGLTITNVQILSANQISCTATVDEDAAAGQRMLTVVNRDGQRSNPGILTVSPRPPQVISVTPPSLVAGQIPTTVNINGQFFKPGAEIRSNSPGLTIGNTRFISPSLLQVTMTAMAGATPGPITVQVFNPDGGVSMPPGTMLLYPENAMGAPVAVTTAAIVHPRPGTVLGPGEEVFPRALLSTTGTGTVVVSWNLDGAPFDRVVAVTSAGMPVEIEANLPIPVSFTGDHRLELKVEMPEAAIAAEIVVSRSEKPAASLRVTAPENRAILGRQPTTFRWSLVPGAREYELTFDRDKPLLPAVIRTKDSHWQPSPEILAKIGPGLRFWRVRPIFPGSVSGAPTADRTIAILPPSVSLQLQANGQDADTGRPRLSWSGGSPGFIYRITLISSLTDRVTFQALTPEESYVLPLGVDAENARVQITAIGPGGETYGSSQTQELRAAVQTYKSFALALATLTDRVEAVAPADGSEVATPQPQIAARWAGEVNPVDLLLMIDETDVTQLSTRRPTSIRYDCFVPLAPGQHVVRLSLGGQEISWQFSVIGGDDTLAIPLEGATEPEVVQPAESQIRSNWVFNLQGMLTYADEAVETQSDAAIVQFSGQADLDNEQLFVKAAGNVSVRHDFEEPTGTKQQSRNWLVEAGARQRDGGFREQVTVGYAQPSFDQNSQLLTTGLARLGAEALLVTPALSASFYHSFSSTPAGVVSGNTGPDQEVLAWSLSTPEIWKKVNIQIVGMEVDEQPGYNTSGGEGRVFGIIGRFEISPFLKLVVEGAEGEFEPGLNSVETARSGNAFRLSLSGNSGTFGYSMNLRRTDADFVNPANRGLTIGGVSDRQGGDVQMHKSFGASVLSASLRYLENGTSSGTNSPSTSELGGTLSLSSVLSSAVTFQVGANISDMSGDADSETLLPATDLTMRGLNLSFTERIGTLNLMQSLMYQDMTNRVLENADQEITSANFSATQMVSNGFMITGLLSGTRSEGSPQVGTTDNRLVSLQPTWMAQSIGFSIMPRASYNVTENSLSALETRSEQYQVLLTYAPPRLGSLLSLQLSGDWSRSRITGLPDNGFQRRIALTLSISWGAQSGSAQAQPSAAYGPPPGSFSPGVPMARLWRQDDTTAMRW